MTKRLDGKCFNYIETDSFLYSVCDVPIAVFQKAMLGETGKRLERTGDSFRYLLLVLRRTLMADRAC